VINELEEKIAGEIALSSDPGKTMRKWREEFGLSQYELAEAMDISHSVISDYESGRRKSPGVGVVKKMVDAFISLDMKAGSSTIAKYVSETKTDCIIAMEEFPSGIPIARFIELIGGKNLNPDRLPSKKVYGYTILDSLKAIMSLSSGDYSKIYGWSTERALIFTNVHYGRSPMVAIRAHPLTPALVVYQRPENTDPLAIKLSRLEGVPLVTTELEIADIIRKFNEEKEGK